MTFQDRRMFSKAEAYQRYLGPWGSNLAPGFLDFAGVEDGDRVLDVASGTGSLALALARERSCASIVGMDFSVPYIRFAAARAGDPQLHFHAGDGMELPYRKETFDKSLSQLALNAIPVARRAVMEMRRVTKPGGIVAACVWGPGKDNERDSLFWSAARALNPAVARRLQADGRYDSRDQLTALWAECGLKEIEAADLVVSVDFASFDDFWLPYLEGQGHGGSYVTSLPGEQQEALREHMRQDLLGRKGGGAFVLGAKAVAVRGMR